jgi:hypothetical protein
MVVLRDGEWSVVLLRLALASVPHPVAADRPASLWERRHSGARGRPGRRSQPKGVVPGG